MDPEKDTFVSINQSGGSPMHVDLTSETDASDNEHDPYLYKCKQFAEITSTDNAMAMLFLQDRNWDLKRAVSDYFDAQNNEFNRNKKSEVMLIDMTADNCQQDDNVSQKVSFPVAATDCVFNVLSWNLDGLDKSNLSNRTHAVVTCILSELPHAVCLQEVVIDSLKQIRDSLQSNYHVFSASDDPFAECSHYFACLLVRKHLAIGLTKSPLMVYSFPGSSMGRQLLYVDLTLDPLNLVAKVIGNVSDSTRKLRLRIYTSHLESCQEGSHERKEQLKYVWEQMGRVCAHPDLTNSTDLTCPHVTIFCGDTNLRDSEVAALGGVPTGVVDVWEATGGRSELKATWDPGRNVNCARFFAQRSSRKPFGHRYDRMYLSGNVLEPVDFGLRGLTKVPNSQCFPSDHWAVIGRFSFQKLLRM